ncbi:hypothetical protein Clacol_008520 [Clathrus columnatus]|uniref:Methyltransferase-like protein 7B n=1 Tax=Clathrus columnatus TaxID=1419009 RepID=A0AAV5APF4_9AGAM|nr:hypothetical protein Clacol_008520 [Clathrus columnatus]
MKLSNIFGILTDLRFAIIASAKPTIKAIRDSPSLLFHLQELSKIIFYNVWIVYGREADENRQPMKESLITANSKGTVLDLGAGFGATVRYLSKDKVTRYVAIEPNVMMHKHIKDTAEKAGFSEVDGSLVVLSCGAEDYKVIGSALGGLGTVDTIVSVLTLCSVPNPEQTIKDLVVKLLKPGGEFLFYEHVQSKKKDVSFWQWFWTPIWKTCFDGCALNRPSDEYVRNLPYWEPIPESGRDSEGKQVGVWGNPGEEEEHLWWHQIGRFIKSS